MTVTGSMLRFAGTALLAVAVVGCGGLDRTNRGAGAASDADPTPTGSGPVDAAADEDLAAELDAWLAGSELDSIDAGPGAGSGSAAAVSGTAGTPAPAGGASAAPTPGPLPPFDAGSFADLDATLSTLDSALGAGEPGSEGNLP
ncbi:MAG: hypothetical protein AABZ33_02725 [Chloroflexota bacterium]